MKNKDLLKSIVMQMRGVAEDMGIEPYKLTQKDLLTNTDISEWSLRKLGGFATISKSHYPYPDKALAQIKEQQNINTYVGKLEKQIGEKDLFEEMLLKTLEENLPKLKLKPFKAIKSKQKKKLNREVIVSLNDTHYGAIVKPEEVGGSNKFDWQEACRRTAYLAQQVAEYKEEKRHEVKRLHVILNGDLVQGVIHDLTARTAHLLGIQQCGAMHILTYFINYVSQFYPEVVVHGISGNHDDSPHRREGGRVLSHKYDSVLAPIFYGLSVAFKDSKNIKFNIPKGLSLDVNLPGGRLLVTHGDTLFSKQLGNPSSNLNVRGLSDVINRFNTGEINKGNPLVKMVLMGHVHNHVNFTTFDGVKVYIAPSLSGIDSYAHSISINSNQVGQVIWESTEGHILGDPRLVDLLAADNMSELDKIIPVYQEGLSFEKYIKPVENNNPKSVKSSLVYDSSYDGYKLTTAKDLVNFYVGDKNDWYKYLAGERLHIFPEFDETKHVIQVETYKPELLINEGIPFALYSLSGEAKNEIKPGVYRFHDTRIDWILRKMELSTDDFIDFRKNDQQNLYKDVHDFFKNKDKYIKTRHKGASLLFGPAGGGKTRMISKILENAERDNLICLFITSDLYTLSIVENFKKVLQGKNIVFVFEELTERAGDRYSAEELLSFLDGEMSWSGAYVIGTTNYPERLPENVVDRPGRFNQIIKFDNPNKAERESFLTAKGLTGPELIESVNLSDGLSLDYIVQATVQASIKNVSVSQYLKDFKKTRDLIKQNFKTTKLGIGLSAVDNE